MEVLEIGPAYDTSASRGSSCALAVAILIAACSGGDEPAERPPPEPAPVEPVQAVQDRLLPIEQALAASPLPYGPVDDGRVRPVGAFLEDDTVWVYSRTSTVQKGLRRAADGWRVVAERQGPPDPRRCAHHEGLGTVCATFHGPGAWVASGAALPGVPARGGFTDLQVDGDRLLLVDALEPALYVVHGGEPAERVPLPAGAYGVRPLPGGARLVLSWQAPHLAVHAPGQPPRPLRTRAPVRDVAVDVARGVVWAVGPANRRVQRAGGHLEGLHTEVVAYALDAEQPDRPVQVHDLRAKRLVDGVAITLLGDRLAILAEGSSRLWVLHPDTRHDVVVPVGQDPRGLLRVGEHVLVPSRLDDRLTTVRLSSPLLEPPGPDAVEAESVALGPRPDLLGTDRALGELLFYQRALWADDVANDFTCNTCHWDGLTDHRLQPGFLERRWEITRPAVGMRGVAPVFSPMGSSSLTEAVEGLVSALDLRFWTEHGQQPFLAPVEVHVGGELHVVSGERVRRALLTYLLHLAPRPGPRSSHGENRLTETARRGADLFVRDCARCHEPVRDLRSRQRIPPEQLLDALRSGPLVFGAAQFYKSGVEPYYTSRGNRISPLIALSRGGPYFTSGAAPTLAAVVERTDPGARKVHAARAPVYSEEERDALVAFLQSL